ncbi:MULTISPECIES: glycine betaine ABC transporter substrate-binding protein [unclassified Haladaptatus]|uniref:glycine betaine ABC transporter substrate-binding protein n=1 Tax=unclassified Haladaptatus TaxID=2622732 RepID=UPI00209C681F|nr:MULTISPECIES: glycine betaine ABC transporter substrate-binding protein [unclassified Haladaptatus]MCO8243425.1 glycine/betaine ABC transporter substrate-binding protein [Haladaptatus sp. AB643]MCO8254832.1 glycine/betaine ABC transporter substrate-binding protein [Haladaptatus sp. AB618]
MPRSVTRRRYLKAGGGLAGTAGVGALSGCLTLATELKGGSIKVSSKRFTEQEVLGYIAYEALSSNTDLPINDQIGLGGTTTNFRALDSGEVQLYWEYTGTAWQTLPPQHDTVISDPGKLYRKVKAEFKRKHGLTFLQRAQLNNTYVILANPNWAKKTGVETLSDFADFLGNDGSNLTVALNAEFQSRADGWPGLSKHYGFADDLGNVTVDNIGSGLLYQVIGKGSADVGVGFNTDPRIIQFDLQVLEDDKGYFPVYNAAPLVDSETLENHPEIRSPLNEASDGLTTDVMRRLNKQVAIAKKNPQTVAKEYLRRKEVI